MRLCRLGLLGVLLGACGGGSANVPCQNDGNCDLSSGGKCLDSPSGNMWCGYPDPACPSGYRYSDQNVGDGVGGQCYMTDPEHPDAGPGHDASADAPSVDAMADAGIDAPLGPVDYVVTYGGLQGEYVRNLSSVSDGVLFTGSLASNATLGTTTLTYGGGSDYVRAKLASNGTVMWAFAQDQVDQEELGGSAADPSGNLVIAGAFVGSVSFGGPMLASAGGYDLFLAKYAGATGAYTYAVRYGAGSDEHVQGMCVDPNGDVYVAGYFSGTTNLGGSSLASAGMTDGFVAKYKGSDGTFIWGFRLGGTQADSAHTIACDGTHVVVGGTFRGTINLGGADLVSAGLDDMFLADFNPTNGNHVWSSRYGGTAINDAVASVALANGAVYTTGVFSGSVNFGGTTLSSAGAGDVYVAKYDASTGSHVWSKSFGSSGTEVGNVVAPAGTNIVIGGQFNSSINFGGGDLSSAGGYDAFVATLKQADGSYTDAFRLGGTKDDETDALTNTSGGLVVGGAFQGVTYFGTTQVSSQGMSDGFVFKP